MALIPVEQIFVDLPTRTFHFGDRCFSCTRKTAQFLDILVRHFGRVVSYDAIEFEIWPNEDPTQKALQDCRAAAVAALYRNAAPFEIFNVHGEGWGIRHRVFEQGWTRLRTPAQHYLRNDVWGHKHRRKPK